MLLAVSEIAILSLDKEQLKEPDSNGKKNAVFLLRLANKRNYCVFAMRICACLIWAFFGIAVSALFYQSIAYFLINQNAGIAFVDIFTVLILIVIIIIVAVTYFIMHEINKSRLRQKNPIKTMSFLVRPLKLILLLVRPIVGTIIFTADFILRKSGTTISYGEKSATKEDIIQIVNQSGKRGSIDAIEHEMINNIFEFDDKTAHDICRHRTDIIAIDISAERNEIINTIAEWEFSRIPIYEDSIDNIIGILYTKDLLGMIFSVEKQQKKRHWEINLKEIMRTPYFVPLSKNVSELFESMKKEKIHMAIVVDEYGGTAGLVTVEDLLEEIVGNIYDEHDEVDRPQIEKIGDGRYIIDGATDLEEISEYIGINLPIDDYDTVGGFIIGQLDRIPDDNEKPFFSYEGYIFQVEEAKERRVYSVLVFKSPAENQDNSEISDDSDNSKNKKDSKTSEIQENVDSLEDSEDKKN